MKKFVAVLTLVIVFSTTIAFADPVNYIGLWISDGNTANDVILYGNGGNLNWVGNVGNWNLNVESILTYPLYGTQAVPRIDFSSQNLGGTGTLTIMACVTGFVPSMQEAGFSGLYGGTTAGTVEFSAFSSNITGFFDTNNLIWDSGILTGAFSSTFGGDVPAGAVSYTLMAQITAPAGSANSFDIDFKVPEPTSLLLLGLGLLGIAGIRRKH